MVDALGGKALIQFPNLSLRVNLDFFLAYHHDDDQLAGSVKLELERRGSTAFLAHRDIEISKTWREEILSNLKTCQALIAIVTPNFAQSAYANQEAGIVLGKGKPVISLNFTKDLPGFLESIQAVHASEANLDAAVEKAIKVIQGREPTTYIEPAFKSTLEIENIAVLELLRHFRRQHDLVRESDIAISKIGLNEGTGIFSVEGSARPADGVYPVPWEMTIDARAGKILSKSVVSSA